MRPGDIQPDYEAIQQSNLEHEAVEWMLKICKPPKAHVNRLYQQSRQMHARLSIAVWEATFSAFPFLFAVQPASQLKEFGKLQTFWSGRSRRDELRKLLAVMDSHVGGGGDRLVGVLLKIPYTPGWSFMHGGSRPEAEETGVCLTFGVGDRPPFEAQVHVEPLDQFIHRNIESIQSYFSGLGE